VIDRARFARTLDVAAAERLVRSLVDASPGGEVQARAVASWVESALLAELAPAVYGTLPPETRRRPSCGRWPATGSGRERASRPSSGRGSGTAPAPGRAELPRLERVRARPGNVPLAAALGVCRSPAREGGDHCAAALGPALVSLVYAAHLGDPEGPALAGEDVSLRHDFGAEPWALPERSRARASAGTCRARSSASSGRSPLCRSTSSPGTSSPTNPP